MKKPVFTLIFITALGLSANGQVKYHSLVQDAIKVEDVGSDYIWFNVPNLKTFRDYWGQPPKSNKDQLAHLLNKDVVRYNNLEAEYNTDLKKKAFIASTQGQELLKELSSTYSAVINRDFYYLHDLKNSSWSEYNLSTQRMQTSKSEHEIDYSKTEGNTIIIRGMSLIMPANIPITTTKYYGGSDYFYRQTFSVPLRNEDLALEIENNITNCAVLIIFNHYWCVKNIH